MQNEIAWVDMSKLTAFFTLSKKAICYLKLFEVNKIGRYTFSRYTLVNKRPVDRNTRLKLNYPSIMTSAKETKDHPTLLRSA